MRCWRYVVAVAAGAVLVFGLTTWLALEAQEVVVIRTTTAQSAPRNTRVWIADDADVVWVEAATPERPFYQDILVHPVVEVERQGQRRRYLAEPSANPEGHRNIRRLLRAKYGWADRWVGLLQDTSQSLGIRLRPVAD